MVSLVNLSQFDRRHIVARVNEREVNLVSIDGVGVDGQIERTGVPFSVHDDLARLSRKGIAAVEAHALEIVISECHSLGVNIVASLRRGELNTRAGSSTIESSEHLSTSTDRNGSFAKDLVIGALNDDTGNEVIKYTTQEINQISVLVFQRDEMLDNLCVLIEQSLNVLVSSSRSLSNLLSHLCSSQSLGDSSNLLVDIRLCILKSLVCILLDGSIVNERILQLLDACRVSLDACIQSIVGSDELLNELIVRPGLGSCSCSCSLQAGESLRSIRHIGRTQLVDSRLQVGNSRLQAVYSLLSASSSSQSVSLIGASLSCSNQTVERCDVSGIGFRSRCQCGLCRLKVLDSSVEVTVSHLKFSDLSVVLRNLQVGSLSVRLLQVGSLSVCLLQVGSLSLHLLQILSKFRFQLVALCAASRLSSLQRSDFCIQVSDLSIQLIDVIFTIVLTRGQ